VVVVIMVFNTWENPSLHPDKLSPMMHHSSCAKECTQWTCPGTMVLNDEAGS